MRRGGGGKRRGGRWSEGCEGGWGLGCQQVAPAVRGGEGVGVRGLRGGCSVGDQQVVPAVRRGGGREVEWRARGLGCGWSAGRASGEDKDWGVE